MMSNLEKAYEADIRIRQPKQGFTVDAKDFTEGVVYRRGSHGHLDRRFRRGPTHSLTVIPSGPEAKQSLIIVRSFALNADRDAGQFRSLV
jgi:hypothetical protein